MRKRLSRVFAIAAVLALGVTGCGGTEVGQEATTASETASTQASEQNTDNSEITVRVGINANDWNQTLKIVDDHTGLFSDKGIHIETTEFANGINTIDAITLNQIDIGLFADYAGVNRIGNTVGDNELRAFVNAGVDRSQALYVNPEVIKEPADLENAKLINFAGVVYEYEYGKLFEHYGLDQSKKNFVNVNNYQDVLAVAQSGEGDVFWGGGNVRNQLESYGWQPLITLDEIDAAMFLYNVSTETYLTEHQSDVERFIEASIEGIDYVNEHLDEVAGWVSAETGIDTEIFKNTWNDRDYSSGYSFTQEAADDLQKVEKWCHENGNFDNDFDVDEYINVDALKAVDESRVTYTGESVAQ